MPNCKGALAAGSAVSSADVRDVGDSNRQESFGLLERLEGFLIRSGTRLVGRPANFDGSVALRSPAAWCAASPLDSGAPISLERSQGAQAALSREIVKQSGRHSQLCN
jgi:hypothetical protein